MWGHLWIVLVWNSIVKYFGASPRPVLVLHILGLVRIDQYGQDVYGDRILTQEGDVYLIGCKDFTTNLVAPAAMDLESLAWIFKPSDITRLICWLSICVACEDRKISLFVIFLSDKLNEKWWWTIKVNFADNGDFID